ncbi:MAG: hypothetical protein SOT54_06210 [Candidatus Limivivens sp.]|nr:hypothetical protein [Candidatus Limivivens sp.]
MKKIRNILFLFLALLLTGCGAKTPEKLIRSELEQIKKLDEKTIRNFVSYQDIVQNKMRDTDVGEETTEAVRLFFQNFDYSVLSTESADDKAEVIVEIRNLDSRSLAHDLCLSLTRIAADPRASQTDTMNSYFTVLRDILKSNTYETARTEAHFNLIRQSGSWVIQTTDSLKDEIVGGLISALQDPYLLTPEEVAAATLDVFTDFSPEDWISYLDMHDVFAIGSEQSDQVDQSLAARIASCFQYKVTQLRVDHEDATASADITSLDMTSVLKAYRKKLLAYAETTESLRASDSEIADKSAGFLKEALDENEDTILRSVPLTFHNNGSAWEMSIGEEFSEVLLGGSEDALNAFHDNE